MITALKLTPTWAELAEQELHWTPKVGHTVLDWQPPFKWFVGGKNQYFLQSP